MPTGYTDKIYKGIGFKDFVLNCSRAFSSFVHMRDESSNAPLTFPVVSDYHSEGLNNSMEKMRKLRELNQSGKESGALESFGRALEYHAESVVESAKKREQLTEMREQVDAWRPPSEKHVGLKTFMLKQIDETIKFDCRDGDDLPVLATPEEWHESKLKRVRWDVDYHLKNVKEERERNESDRKWITALFESLGLESQLEKMKETA